MADSKTGVMAIIGWEMRTWYVISRLIYDIYFMHMLYYVKYFFILSCIKVGNVTYECLDRNKDIVMSELDEKLFIYTGLKSILNTSNLHNTFEDR